MRFGRSIFLLVLVLLFSVLLTCGSDTEEEAHRPKLFFLGLDGADWKVIDAMIAEGDLPNFKRIRKQGATATLHSYSPLKSPVVWTSIATGRLPQDHNILDFFYVAEDGRRIPVHRGLRPVPTFWEVAYEHDRSVGLVGYFASGPASPETTFHITDLAFTGEGRFVGSPASRWPSDLYERLDLRPSFVPGSEEAAKFIERYIPFGFDPSLADRETPQGLRHHIVDWALNKSMPRELTYSDYGLRMWMEEKPDVFVLYLRGIDIVCHNSWKYYQPQEFEDDPPSEEDLEWLGELVPEQYRWTDELLGKILDELPPDTILALASDHGFMRGEFEGEQGYLSGGHRAKGIFALYGPGVKAGEQEEVATYDIAPTFLYLLGLPVSKELVGQTLSTFFEDSFRESTEEIYVEEYDSRPIHVDLMNDVSEAFRKSHLEGLESLGYLDAAAPEDQRGSRRTRWLSQKDWMRVIRGQLRFLLDRNRFEAAREVFEFEQKAQFLNEEQLAHLTRVLTRVLSQ